MAQEQEGPPDESPHVARVTPSRRPRPSRAVRIVTSAATALAGLVDITQRHYNAPLSEVDPDIATLVAKEHEREANTIELIASENNASQAVIDALGTVFTNKYAEGLPGARFYNGCAVVDEVEQLAIDRAKKLFDCGFADVQPHSGADANTAVYKALLKPGDTMMGMALDAGGHLTHGTKMNVSGSTYKSVQYGQLKDGTLNPDGTLNYDKIEELALVTMPTMLVAGASSYSRQLDFKRFREIVDKVNDKFKADAKPGEEPKKCWYMVDMAHYAGLVAGGQYESPIPYADVVTTTTHKSLRGPRGGLILAKDPSIIVEAARPSKLDATKMLPAKTLGEALNKAVFPGIQGGPLMNVIAAKAVCFGEALKPEFKAYTQRVADNAKELAATFQERDIGIVMGGTDSHVMTIDLRSKDAGDKVVSGKDLANAMERAGLIANKNAVPADPNPPTVTSGVRLGTPAATTRGFGKEEFRQIGSWVADIVQAMRRGEPTTELEGKIRGEVQALCDRFPIYEEHGREKGRAA